MAFFLSSLTNKLPMIISMILLLLMSLFDCELAVATTGSGCDRRCGDIDIPYPFGTSEGCYLANDTYREENFLLTCTNDSMLSWDKVIRNDSILISQINVSAGHVKTLFPNIAENCYNESGQTLETTAGSFVVSTTENKFTVLGCDTYGQMSHIQNNMTFYSACTSYCASETNVKDGKCDGLGCCQVPISQNTQRVDNSVLSYYNHTKVFNFNPCGYAFIADTSVYKFSTKHLKKMPTMEERPIVLEWAISNKTCREAEKDTQTFACIGQNTVCLDVENGVGYRCICSDGYNGNPYLDGCKDTNECNDPKLNECVKICKDRNGGYECSCPWGYHGNGRKSGTGCSRAFPLVAIIVLSTAIGITSLFMVLIWVYHLVNKRNLKKLREKFFQKNGGFMLRNQLSSSQGSSSSETVQIFTAVELEEATDRYSKANILGEGGFGTVYKGVLPNKKVVAVKVSKNMQRGQVEQFMSGEKKGQVEEFINEVIILSQVNHRHIVKLLGCCLETEVPLLVYEYISNGTLHDHIHSKNDKTSSHLMSWENRFRIASETANAISYLHSSASIPIIHRDIKSTNILLDEKYVAKVSDFGASRLVSIDTMELSTMVQGTLGYLDPEYLQTSQLTDKSDVYSFGVILAELLTGRSVLRFDCEDQKDKNLATYFLSALKNNRLAEILEDNILKEESFDRIKEVANVTKMCLRVRGEDRPSMKEVAMELEGLRLSGKHPWMKDDNEETECLIDVTLETSNSYEFGDKRTIEMGYHSTQKQIGYPTSMGR
ncbi:putative wall-associated receptor kinase-like 16 [Impatiens glandulifera]|uniref:putative wall-associated receptor kinase-like 16 n=1 Tax=Impatiens glandulifera TaxID=253017 RepID=UPI001FB07B9B|nr:putative wall-associated receptor kinase-like 16 [Impatiens glandulifera]